VCPTLPPEQVGLGKDRSAPWHTLDAIARVLRLDDAGREYLFELSAKDAARPRQRRAQKVPMHFQRLGLDPTPEGKR
jgi:hypothetical protein